MVIIASTLVDVLIAAPLGFLIGLMVGLFMANKYIIIRPRENYEVVHSDYRNHNQERGDRSSD